MSALPVPFRIAVAEAALIDLRERLSRTRWPDRVPGSGWEFGTDLDYLQALVAYWANDFDWRKHESELNAFQQYEVELDGINIHFIHEPGVGPAPMPLLLVHGWPGSVWEFHDLIPRLTDPARFGGDPHDAFTVVAPSLPGFTLSYRPNQRRVDLPGMADLFAQLMSVLGYNQFAAQGGDWGSYIVARLGASHGHRLHGIHLNFMPLRPDLPLPIDLSDYEMRYKEELHHWQTEEIGYHAIQGTRPQTLAYALTDSPAGLAGWIVEKFHSFTDHDGDLENAVDRDALLTNISLYWLTGAVNSSFWPYYAARHGPWPLPEERIEVPTAFASFPRETRHPPRWLAETAFDIRRWTEMPRGGHFAALEVPGLLRQDVAEFFRDFR